MDDFSGNILSLLSAEEFRGNRQNGKGSWNAHGVREHSYSPIKSIDAEPAEQLLDAMGKKDEAQHKP
jgi:hypothetical protein